MEYNEIIADISGQNKIKQKFLYSVQNENNAIYQIIGDRGSGKRTLCEKLANAWMLQTNGKVFYLNNSYQEVPEDYSTFKNFLYRNCKEQKILNVFKDALRDIPYIGNSLSAITKELNDVLERKKKLEDNFTQNEQYIFEVIEKLSQNSDILFLCYDFEFWDLKSQQVLLHLVEILKNIFCNRKVFFVFSSENKKSSTKTTARKVYLNEIHEDEIEEVAMQLSPQIHLNDKQKKHIYELTNGNLELIKESLNLFEANVIPLSYNFYDIIQNNLNRVFANGKETLHLFKQIAFVGERVDSRLLKIFSELDSELYEQLLGEAINFCYLQENGYTISFVKKFIFTIIKDCLYKDRKYYLRLSKCISLLYPSRYDLQMYYLYRGGLIQQADKMFLIYLISYFRENNIQYELSDVDKRSLSQSSLYFTYEKICFCYQLYKSKRYDEAENTLLNLYCEDIGFRFEKDYLLSLVVTNKYFTTEEFMERIDALSTYITEEFHNTYPEMYLRALMMLAEFYSETINERELRECLKKINKNFSQYTATDKQMQCYEHCFKLKANAFYKVEIAYKYTKDAYNYFSLPENRNIYLSKYYLSILNYSANLIILGKYNEAYDLLTNAVYIVHENIYLKNIHEDILLNNLAISGCLSNIFSSLESVDILNSIIAKVTEAADNILIQNNITTFLALAGQYEKALHIAYLLYSKIQYGADVDTYYRYFISNNYGILLWICQKKDDSLKVLSEAFKITPLLKNATYFSTRSKMIFSLIQNMHSSEIINNKDWNNIIYKQHPHIVGEAWKYWSSLMLLSELQIWSDF